MSKLTIEVTKAEFENRVVDVIETAMGSPLVKKRKTILSSAMVTLLHGKREDGKHEHNLNQFWSSEQTAPASTSAWVVTEDYHHDSDYSGEASTFTTDSEEAAKRQLYTSVCGYITDSLAFIVDMPILLEKLSEAGSDCGLRFLEGIDKTAEQCDEFDVAELLDSMCNEDLKTHEAAFEYITNLMCIDGTHSITEVELDALTPPKQPDSVAQQPTSITIHTIIEVHKADGEDGDSDDISVSSTTSAEKHDRDLLALFQKYVNDESGLSFDELVEHEITQDVICDMDMEEDEIREKSYEQLVDLLCSHCRPNMLIDIIPDATYGLVYIDVRYEDETL